MTTVPTPSSDPLARLRGTVRRTRSRARRLLQVRAAGRLLALLVLGLMGLILLDFVLRFPAALRWIMLIGAGVATVHLIRRWWLPAWRFAPGETEVALRLERSAGQAWTGRLASGLELAQTHPDSEEDEARALRAAAVHRALADFNPASVTGAVDPAPARRALLAAAAVVALASLALWMQPANARTGLQRVLTPWTEAKWPRRQIVEHVEGAGVLPIDRAVPLRAMVTKTNRSAGETPVWAEYRVTVGSDTRAWERVRLTAQSAANTPGTGGELYERLVEPGVSVGEQDGADGTARETVTLEYRLLTEDDQTRRRTLRLTPPPRITAGRLTLTPPSYLAGLPAAGDFKSGELELGPGRDRRSVVGPVLAGSRFELALTFNKSVPTAALLELVNNFEFGSTASAPEQLAISPREDGTGVTLADVVREPALLPLVLTDAYGIKTRGEPAYRIEVIEDMEPSITVALPERDEAVLATAIVPLRAQAEDDLGLESLVLLAEVATLASETTEGEFTLIEQDASGQSAAAAETTLELAPLGLNPGDEVRLTAAARDVYRDANNNPREQVRSRVRVLRVISETALVNQIRSELNGVRRAAMRLDEEQATLERATRGEPDEAAPDLDAELDELNDPEPRNAPAAETALAQDELANRVRQQLEAAQRLSQRLDANGLDNEALDELLEQGEQILDRAEEAAREAAERLARDDREGAEDEQREVRDELARLVGLLDRGEDSWLARQGLERLLAEQEQIQEQTAAIQEQTLGRELDQLSQDERSALQKIADRQRAAAQQATEAIDELAEAAERLRERDPTQAEALEQAAATARRARLPERLNQAAEQVDQNQTQQAQQQQEQAIDELQDALEQLDQGEQLRDEALRRVLASLVESLEALVQDQALALVRLDAADDVAGLDVGMISINQRTVSAIAQASEGGPDLAVVTDRLNRADNAQQRAISALRAEGAQADRVRGFEQASLDHLQAALDEAKAAEQQASDRAAAREQAELRQAYTQLAERQRNLITQTEPFLERRLSRRERAEARAVADAQDVLAEEIDAVEGAHPDITDSPVFSLAHRRLAELSGKVSEAIRAGSPGARTALQQEAIASLLEQLAASLASDSDAGEGFEQDSASSQGGGGGGGSGGDEPSAIPPVAELIVLRLLQDQAGQLTELADQSQDPVDLDEAVQLQREVSEQAQKLLESLQEGENPDSASGIGPDSNPQPTGLVNPLDPADDGMQGESSRLPEEEGSGAGLSEQPTSAAEPTVPASLEPTP